MNPLTGSTGAAVSGFTVKPRTTAKARHKDDQARVTAHARAVGRTGKLRERDFAEGAAAAPAEPRQPPQVPEVPRRAGEPDGAREHLRRDINSRIAVFELGAPDNPPDLTAPFTDPRGAVMRWAVRCLTHGQTRYHAEHRRALQAVKGSHAWCPGCASAVAGSRRIRNRARAQRMQRRSTP